MPIIVICTFRDILSFLYMIFAVQKIQEIVINVFAFGENN